VHIDDRVFFYLLILSPVFTLLLPRCWTGAKNKCTGRIIFLTAHIEKKLYRVTEVGRENATKMNARYSLNPDEWIKQFSSDCPYHMAYTRTIIIIIMTLNARKKYQRDFILVHIYFSPWTSFFFLFKLYMHTDTYSTIQLVREKR